MKMRQTVQMLCLSALAAFAVACVNTSTAPADLLPSTTAAEDSAPLGGEALAQRKDEMRRAHSDIVHFDATLFSLNHRRDKNGRILFSKFLDAFLGLHVDPMLGGEWQSNHPELAALDANLRLAKAEILIQLGMTRRAQSVMDEIEARFAGREDMLVDFPFGEQHSLRESLQMLSHRKWRG